MFTERIPARKPGGGLIRLPVPMDLLIAIAAGWLTLAAVLTAAVARGLRIRDDR
jgi:hypothetical protein